MGRRHRETWMERSRQGGETKTTGVRDPDRGRDTKEGRADQETLKKRQRDREGETEMGGPRNWGEPKRQGGRPRDRKGVSETGRERDGDRMERMRQRGRKGRD